MKIVYVVTGSEDGILGVYGNKKGAYKEALKYVNRYIIENNFKVVGYSKVCSELKNVYNYGIDIIDELSSATKNKYVDINATISAVPFNHNIYGEK